MTLPMLTDPKTKAVSVTFTLLMLSTLCIIVAIGLNIAKVTDQTGAALQWFYANAALYLGRRWTGSTQTIDNDPNPAQPTPPASN